MLFKSQLYWAGSSPGWGIITFPGPYCAVRSLLAVKREGHQKSNFRSAWNKPLVPVTSTITLAENHDFTYHVVSSFKNTKRANLKNKRHRRLRNNYNIMLSSPNQSFSCSWCDHPCLFHIDLICHKCDCSQHELPPSWSSFHKAKPWWQ